MANRNLALRRALLAAALTVSTGSAIAQPRPAADASAFTPAQRQEIIAVVRQALKADPSILRDAVQSLQADDAARDAADTKARIAANETKLLSRVGDQVAGNPNGDLTIVEFYDPRCPYCRRMLPALDALLHTDHGIRLVYKEIPVLGAASLTESKAILAAQNQGGYIKMQNALMSQSGEPTESLIHDAARQAGLDPAKLATDMKSPAVSNRIQENLALARELKVDGTPAFIVGNQLIPGAVGEDGLETVITAVRKKT